MYCSRAVPDSRQSRVIVEHVLKAGLKRSMILYWERNLEGLYLDDLAAKWGTDAAGFKYVPVLSDMPADLG